MTNKEIADKLADLAWEIQPKFKHGFATKEKLSERIQAGYTESGTFGWFLPLCVIETFCNVDYMKSTIAHHQMDEALGITTVNPIDLMSAKLNLKSIESVLPMFDNYCSNWAKEDES